MCFLPFPFGAALLYPSTVCNPHITFDCQLGINFITSSSLESDTAGHRSDLCKPQGLIYPVCPLLNTPSLVHVGSHRSPPDYGSVRSYGGWLYCPTFSLTDSNRFDCPAFLSLQKTPCLQYAIWNHRFPLTIGTWPYIPPTSGSLTAQMHGQPHTIKRRAQHTVPPMGLDPHIIATFQLSHLPVGPLQSRFAARHHHPLAPRLVIPLAIALAERHDPLNPHRLSSGHGCGKQRIEHLPVLLLRRGRRHDSTFIVQICHIYIYCGYGSHRPAHSLAPLAFPLRATHRGANTRLRAMRSQ